MFDAKLDPAVNFCRMGAVLGHEMTHGFDWTGKQFDKDGNMKNWWQACGRRSLRRPGAETDHAGQQLRGVCPG